MSKRNILILTACQLISATGAFTMVTLGGIIGATLSSKPALATLPVSVMVLCVAASTIPATVLMRRIGRRAGFALASSSAVLSTALAGVALFQQSFGIFIVAGAVFGINMAFTQQYRYAAAESVAPQYSARAISFVLLGAIGGALVGEQLVRHGVGVFDNVQYLGTLVALAAMYVLQAVLFVSLGPMRGEEPGTVAVAPRGLRQIVRQPVFVVAVLGGATAYGVMTFIMTATPLSMHVHDGFALDDTTRVIRNHVLGMYAPSLFSGFLIERYGVVRLMAVGAVGLLAACVVALQGQSYMHYWYALILLGVGWNFLYVGSTTMVTRTYALAERFRAQAVNEFCIFGTSATASLLAGTIIFLYGWHTLVLAAIPLLVLIFIGLYLVRSDPLVRRLQAKAA